MAQEHDEKKAAESFADWKSRLTERAAQVCGDGALLADAAPDRTTLPAKIRQLPPENDF